MRQRKKQRKQLNKEIKKGGTKKREGENASGRRIKWPRGR
jgi:hypothetical protein